MARQKSILKLDLCEHAEPLPQPVIAALAKQSKAAQWYARSNDYLSLRGALARYHHCLAEQIVIADGSYRALELIMFPLSSEDQIVIPTPTFPFYVKYEEFNKCQIVKVPYPANDILDIQQIINAITPRTKLIYLVNPNNPLGTLSPLSSIETLLQAAPPTCGVIIDEAYADFAGSSAVSLTHAYQNLIIVRTFTKSFGLGSIKCGYSIAAQSWAQRFEAARGPYFGMNRLALAAAQTALSHDSDMRRYVGRIITAKQQLELFLSENSITYFPSAANFVTFRVDDPDVCATALAQRGILAKSLAGYPDGNQLISHSIRLTVPPAAALKKIIITLKNILPYANGNRNQILGYQSGKTADCTTTSGSCVRSS